MLLATLLYHLFILMLWRSTDVDQKAGKLFPLNSPGLAIWVISLWLGLSQSFVAGLVAIATQVAIAFIMVVLHIGDIKGICVINGVIVVSLLLLTAISAMGLPSRNFRNISNKIENATPSPSGSF